MTDIEYLQKVIEEKYETKKETLFINSRSPKIAYPRFGYWYLLRNLLRWSFMRIGEHTGRDHTTVINGIQRFIASGGEDVFDLNEMKQKMMALEVERTRDYSDIVPVDNEGKSE